VAGSFPGSPEIGSGSSLEQLVPNRITKRITNGRRKFMDEFIHITSIVGPFRCQKILARHLSACSGLITKEKPPIGRTTGSID
jgi:hypothetical protein